MSAILLVPLNYTNYESSHYVMMLVVLLVSGWVIDIYEKWLLR